MTAADAQKYEDAITTLFEWDFFRDEFKGVGLNGIRGILQVRLLRQKEAEAATPKAAGFGAGEEGAVAAQK